MCPNEIHNDFVRLISGPRKIRNLDTNNVLEEEEKNYSKSNNVTHLRSILKYQLECCNVGIPKQHQYTSFVRCKKTELIQNLQ